MLKFTILADAHYKKGMYPTTAGDLETILDRANENDSRFVFHFGDLCNDYKGSPEFIGAYLNNKYGLKVYGVYGNHELESAGNSMELVTPCLTNDSEVIFGTADGKIGDGLIGYYHFDIDGYRIVCTDTNYSKNPETGEYEHNRTASWGPPDGNTEVNALGPVQLKWLEAVLTDAAEKGLRCLVMSHASLAESFSGNSFDCEAVSAIFERVNKIRPQTVLMQINGHSHLDRLEKIGDIVYFSVNTTTNGLWKTWNTDHYADESLRFELEKYDSDGKLVEVENIPIKQLWMSAKTHYFSSVLSANISLDEDEIGIDGCTTEWRFGIEPPAEIIPPNKGTIISSAVFKLK